MASLTKSQLLSELVNHGVTPPSPGVRKEKLVQMYEKHVAPHQQAAGEFSSDDEGAAKENGIEGSVSSLATDISELNNEELAEHLRSHGVNVGPIVGSTRRLYERKLSKLLGESAGGAAQLSTSTRRTTTTTTVSTVVNGGGGEDEYSDSEPEPEPEPPREPELRKRRAVGTATPATTAAPASQPSDPRGTAVRAVFLRDEADQPSPRRAVKDVRGSYPREQYLFTKSAAAGSYASAAPTYSEAPPPASQKPASGGRLRTLVKLCLLLLVLAVGYYCYQHSSEAPSFADLQQAARQAARRAAEKVQDLRQAAAGGADGKQT